MKYKKILLAIILVLIGSLLGFTAAKTGLETNLQVNEMDTMHLTSFKVIGDVINVIEVEGLNQFATIEMKHRDRIMEFFSLEEVIMSAYPIVEEYEVLFVGRDGLMAKIDGEGMEGCHITYSYEYAWELVNDNHPISSNIKKLKEIVVISKENNWEDGVNIISPTENILNMTPGQMYLQELIRYPHFEGKSSLERNGRTYDTSVYTTKKIIRLQDLVDIPQDKLLLAVSDRGDYRYIDGRGYFELKNNSINYIDTHNKKTVEEVKGIFIDPPAVSIMDTYYDALHFMKQDEKVMVLFLDGFGYHQYLEAMNKGYAPFLNSLERAEKASTVYRPVTNAGFAAMITGEPPFVNGINSRNQRVLKVPSIFSWALELNKKAALIQGPINVLDTEIQPILNMDRNNNGIADDEIYERALEEIEKDYNLMLIHFKAIDIYGHSYGDFDERTMASIKMIDQYVEELVKVWEGKVIITSDHGMHSTDEGGYHGNFQIEDMIVPYLVIEGGDRS